MAQEPHAKSLAPFMKPLVTRKRCESSPAPASRSRFAALKAATVSGAVKAFSGDNAAPGRYEARGC